MRVRVFISTAAAALALCVASAAAAAQEPAPKTAEPTKQEPAQTKQADAIKQEPPAAKKNARPAGEAPAADPFDAMTAEQLAGRCVTLDTEAGAVAFELFPEAAPETVRNILNLTAVGAFDTTTFSRVVKNFVVQGGNVMTREQLTPELLRRAARTVPDEPNLVKHLRGVVSLARPAEPNSASSHFFILLNDAPHLDGKFAAFGRVTTGMDVVDKIAAGDLDGEKPKSPVRIRRATVAPCQPPTPK